MGIANFLFPPCYDSSSWVNDPINVFSRENTGNSGSFVELYSKFAALYTQAFSKFFSGKLKGNESECFGKCGIWLNGSSGVGGRLRRSTKRVDVNERKINSCQQYQICGWYLSAFLCHLFIFFTSLIHHPWSRLRRPQVKWTAEKCEKKTNT